MQIQNVSVLQYHTVQRGTVISVLPFHLLHIVGWRNRHIYYIFILLLHYLFILNFYAACSSLK